MLTSVTSESFDSSTTTTAEALIAFSIDSSGVLSVGSLGGVAVASVFEGAVTEDDLGGVYLYRITLHRDAPPH